MKIYPRNENIFLILEYACIAMAKTCQHQSFQFSTIPTNPNSCAKVSNFLSQTFFVNAIHFSCLDFDGKNTGNDMAQFKFCYIETLKL